MKVIKVVAAIIMDEDKIFATQRGYGDYSGGCLTLPAEGQQPIGVFGKRHLRYLKEYRRVTYTNLLTSGRLNTYLKSINNSHMQDGYGECLYGYKNDRIVDLIGPIGLYTLTKKADADADLPDTMKRPYIAQVITFDVLYDIEEAKTELQYLFSVIDMFDLSDNNKKMFLQEILQYWILSVKDSKWKAERERRYVIFLYDDYEYIETELDDTFLKVKTSLFITPDFIIGKNPSKWEIMRQLAAKRKALFSKEYLFCEDCLMQDHDVAIHEKPEKCPICGSKNIRMIYHENA